MNSHETPPRAMNGSHRDYVSRLKIFVLWADDMRDIDGRTYEQFKTDRASQDLSPNTVRNYLMTFCVFVRWCEANEYVVPGTADKIRISRVCESDRARDENLEHQTMQNVVGALMKYDYASLRHIAVHLLWHTGLRMVRTSVGYGRLVPRSGVHRGQTST